MSNLQSYIQQVAAARQQFLQEVADLSLAQAQFKPSPEAWSITEITEHIVLAERIGVNRMWQAVQGFKNNQPVWEGEPIHEGSSIEVVIDQTWQTKEKVPDVAKPRWGGPIAFWEASLEACQPVLEKLGKELEGLNLKQIIYPHPISGPLNIYQRLDFLRFHLERHREQIQRVKSTPGYLGE